jgi:Tol biopolymer transport system component
MQDLIGRTLGHYRIANKIGEGGMGVVYRAHDERLDRDVAIKVLPEEVSENTDRLARFDREAKAVAKLAHPNILEIWDFGTEECITYAVTELLEGENLRERIPLDGLGWQRASEIGAAVADGLAAAHGKGIVHRDLKPENIFLTSDGRVKILDFGLAQIKTPIEEDAETATLTPEGTVPGTIMGTLGYMSPEQLRGEPVDGRSDIFALGCVLYEMVVGKAPFLRASTAETSAAILKEEPAPLSATGATLPAELERTVRRCLEKSPEARFQSSSDLAYNLRSITTDHAVQIVTPTAVTPAPRRRRATWIGAGTVIVASMVLLGWISLRPSEPDLQPLRTAPLTSFPGEELYPAISPDGSMVAFVRRGESGTLDLYVKLIGGGDPLLVSDGSSHSSWPSWSPDGRQIAFYRAIASEGGGYSVTVELVAALGGQRRQLTTTRSSYVEGLSWSPDGSTLAMVDRESPDEPNAIFLLSFETGEKRRLTTPPKGQLGENCPRFSPDGRTVAFVREGVFGKSDIFLIPMDGGEMRRLTTDNGITLGLDWAADGQSVIFAAARAGRTDWMSLWRVPATGGEPEALGVGDPGRLPAVSLHGNRLCYVKSETGWDIWRVGGPAAGEEDRKPVRFISSTQYENFPEYSPDGRQILFGSYRTGSDEIWICDSDGTNPRQLTQFKRPGGALTAAWSPDGNQIAFLSIENDNHEIYVVNASGGIPRRITPESSDEAYPSWSRDGRFIYFGSNRTGRFEVFRMPAVGGEAQQISVDGGLDAAESPDGRHLYFTKRGLEGGPRGIWRMPIDGGKAVQVHDSGGFDHWEVVENGICLLNLRSDPPSIELLDFDTGEINLVAVLEGQPTRMGFSVSPDRRWILYQVNETESDIMLVENFR